MLSIANLNTNQMIHLTRNFLGLGYQKFIIFHSTHMQSFELPVFGVSDLLPAVTEISREGVSIPPEQIAILDSAIAHAEANSLAVQVNGGVYREGFLKRFRNALLENAKNAESVSR